MQKHSKKVKNMDELKNLIDELMGDGYREGPQWNGYRVYIPTYNQPMYIGLPLVVLEKDGEYRISTDEEAMQYLSVSTDTEMTDLVTYIVKMLVDDQDAVDVVSDCGQEVETVTIHVAENDVGKVIGKQGKIAMSIRTLAKAVGQRHGKKYVIEIAD